MDSNRYITYELHAKEIRRWFVLCIILLILLIGTAAGWIISEKQHYRDDFGMETMWIVQDEDPAEEFQTFG